MSKASNGLRALADWMDENEEYAEKLATDVSFYAFPEKREELEGWARALGQVDKRFSSVWFSLERDFGGGVRITATIGRERVCERIEVGTKTVPAQPARPEHEEPVYEWKCDDPIMSGAKEL